MNCIKGSFRKSIYNSGNGFIIGLFKIRETDDDEMKDYVNKTITFQGNFVDLNIDDNYVFYGEPSNHPKYGFQYVVSKYDLIKPEEKDGIIEFLSSDLFVGVGRRSATKIVEVLGEKTLDLILENKSNLLMVPGVKAKIVNIVYNTLIKYNESHATIVYLTNMGFSMKDSLKIYNLYKEDTIKNIENNIYDIIEDIDLIHFEKIDDIAKKLNYDKYDERRINALIIYAMKNLVFENGDTYLNKENIVFFVNNYLRESINIDNNLIDLFKNNKIKILDGNHYLSDMYDSEINISNRLFYLSNKEAIKDKKIDKIIDKIQTNFSLTYNDKQKEAIKKSLENNLLIITGGPGTGKTTVIKGIIEAIKEYYDYNYELLVNNIALLAPTGRAAKRMSETTSLPATTIHRFLKWNKDTNEFSVNEYNIDDRKLIIIDEVSMIDSSLFDSLLKGLYKDTKFILVGDYNQLPSVGPGNILEELIKSEIIDVVHLDHLYRQSENSYIVTLASDIKNNTIEDVFVKKSDDFSFIKSSTYNICDNVVQICKKAKIKGYTDLDIQVLVPMYRGKNGIDNLNIELQNIFNPPSIDKIDYEYSGITYRENDKVLQLNNMPDSNIFNGDIGRIESIIKDKKTNKIEIYIDFYGNKIKYLTKDLINIKHGYAISIHKAQGSEFPLVIMPLDMAYRRMLFKKLVYTGITRAKKSLILIGDENALKYACCDEAKIVRNTSLKKFLLNNIK